MRALKLLIPVLMIAISAFVAKIILDNPPAAKPRPSAPERPLAVNAIKVNAETWSVTIDTYGTVEASTETSLIPQVAGKIVSVSPNFDNGGYIDKDATILKIDPADYRIAVKTAQASLAQARATLSEQNALSDQAIRDWKRLGRSGEPGDLVARKPQLDAARAQVASAQAQLEKARLDLARTDIKAPYKGRIKNKQVSIGQYVTPGTVLTEFFATDSVRLRLPLSQADLDWLTIPDEKEKNGSRVRFYDDGVQEWQGTISRSEGILDSKTRQLYVTAEINTADQAASPIVLGQFLNAEIVGRTFDNVFVIPTSLVRNGNSVLVAKNGKITSLPVQVIWHDAQRTIVNEGLSNSSLLVTTPLGDEVEGLAVRVSVDGKPLNDGFESEKAKSKHSPNDKEEKS